MKSEPIQYQGQTYQYSLSAIDVFSRILICRFFQNLSSKLVSKIIHNIFLEYGTSKIIQCDNGGEFKGPFESLESKYGVKKIPNNSSLSPGVTEQMWEVQWTIKKETCISKSFEKVSNWVSNLPRVLRSMNATPMKLLRY